jgi:hypothetical protein
MAKISKTVIELGKAQANKEVRGNEALYTTPAPKERHASCGGTGKMMALIWSAPVLP